MYCLHGSSGTKLCTTKLFKHPIKKMAEVVISPDYYCRGKTEVWDFIREQGLNYHLGNVVKYVCRAGYKDNDIEDLKKPSLT